MAEQDQSSKYLDAEASEGIADSFRRSQKKLILLDYDGTLVPYACEPAKALPDEGLLHLLDKMSSIVNLDLVIISGRHRDFLEGIFGNLKASLFAEHGAMYRINGVWESLENDTSWKDEIVAIMKPFVESTTGSSIEVKQNSVVWHYRKSETGLAEKSVAKLIIKLTPACNRNSLTILKGRKIIEVKPSDYTKGTAIINLFDCNNYDFILAAGDDVTDEDLFEALPHRALKIHIGKFADISDFTVRNSHEFVDFLKFLMNQ
ncbi:MAG: trehalose-phosphatase [Chloroflexota bacterium]